MNPYIHGTTQLQGLVNFVNDAEAASWCFKDAARYAIEIRENEPQSIAKLKDIFESKQIKCIHAVGATVSLAVLQQFARWHENPPSWLIESPLYVYFFISNSTKQQLDYIPAYLWPHLGIAQSIFLIRSNAGPVPIKSPQVAVSFLNDKQGASPSIIDLHVIIHCKKLYPT